MSTEKDIVTKEEIEEKTNIEGATQAGDLLRNKREELGISQEEVANRLRLKLSIIKSIDENNFEFEQVATFIRGYLRSYAKLVSLDEKEVLSALDSANKAQHADQKMQSFSRKTKREKHDSRIMKLTWIIFLTILGISSIWWYQNQQDSLSSSSIVEDITPVSPLVDEPVSPVRPATELDDLEDEAVPTQLPEIDSGDEIISTIQDEAEEIATATEDVVSQETTSTDIDLVDADEITDVDSEAQEESTDELVMSFSADCWIQVKDSTGQTIANGVKKAGYTLSLTGSAPYSIILGAPEGVSMTFANEPVDLSGYNSGKVARFTLP